MNIISRTQRSRIEWHNRCCTEEDMKSPAPPSLNKTTEQLEARRLTDERIVLLTKGEIVALTLSAIIFFLGLAFLMGSFE